MTLRYRCRYCGSPDKAVHTSTCPKSQNKSRTPKRQPAVNTVMRMTVTTREETVITIPYRQLKEMVIKQLGLAASDALEPIAKIDAQLVMLYGDDGPDIDDPAMTVTVIKESEKSDEKEV